METEKLTVNHIAPYLPYGLKGKYTLSNVIILERGQKDEVREKTLDIENPLFFLKYCTPLLLPLDKLTKDFLVDGIEDVTNYLSISDIAKIKENVLYYIPYGHFLRLVSWHFDVFGLIEKGLAIDKSIYKQIL